MAIDNDLNVNVNGRDNLTPQLSQIESRLIRFVGAVSSALTALQVVAFPVTAVRAFEREMANVQKTTAFTDAQIGQLGDQLVSLSRKIDVSAEDLAKIAAAAGQQGLGRYGVEGIRQFTETVSRMSSVLDITAEDASSNIGKIASIFRVSMGDIERVASAFNETANNSTATGEQLLDVVKRIGDASGSLNLQQSIGLAASAIDFGVSPEVAGTSLSKIFSEFYARADKFSELLGISVNDWLTQLNTNGIEAFRQYLEALRTMSEDEQQKIIKQMSGGGRIGSLLTKYVKDTSDTVLNQNIDSSTRGFVQGTSAIKEQATVLQTLDAEAIKASNSFKALGIEAGEVFGPRLAEYLRQLNEQLADPAVVSFAKQVGNAFFDIIEVVAEAITFVADLNVNFENLVTIAKYLLVFKGLEFIYARAGATLAGAADSMQRLRAAATGQVLEGDTGKATSALAATVESYKTAIAQQKEYAAAIAERAQLQKQLELDTAAAVRAEQTAYKAGNAVRQAAEDRTAAGASVTAAKNAAVAAEAAGNQRLIGVRQAFQARLEQAQQAHGQRVAAIEAEFNAKRESARNMGSRALLNAAKRDQAEQLAQEQAYMTRSLRGIETYYTRQMALAEQAAAAQIAASRAALAGAVTQFDTTVAGQGNPRLDANYAATAAAAEAANAKVRETSEALADNQRRIEATATAGTRFVGVLRALGNAMQLIIGVASRVFFWFSILYLALDALGVIERLGPWFERFTDAIGLTSEAARKEAQRQRELASAYEETTRKRREAIASMKEYADASGRVEQAALERIRQNLTDSEGGVRDQAQADLLNLLTSNATAQDANQQNADLLPRRREELNRQVSEYRQQLEEAKTTLAQAEADLAKSFGAAGPSADARSIVLQGAVDRNRQLVADLESALDQATERQRVYGDDVAEELARQATAFEKNSEDITKIVAGLFTDASAQTFQGVVDPFLKAADEIESATRRYEESQRNLQKAEAALDPSSTPSQSQLAAIEAARAANDLAASELENAQTLQDRFRADLQVQVRELKALGKPEDIPLIGSLEFIIGLLASGKNAILQVQGALNTLTAEGTPLTGELAVPSQPASGTGAFNPQSESEQRRLAKARIELARAQLQAEANLIKQSNKEREDELEFSYGRSLTSIKDYYAARLEIARSNLDAEIALQVQTIAAIQEEASASASSVQSKIAEAQAALAGATEDNRAQLEANLASAQNLAGSDQVRMQAQIVAAQGQLAVLQRQRSALVQANAREMSDAVRDLEDALTRQRESVINYLGGGTEFSAFEVALSAAETKYRDTIAKMRANAADFPELFPTLELLESLPAMEALDAALEQVQRQANITGGQFDNMARRIEAALTAGDFTRMGAAGAMEKLRKQQITYQETVIRNIQREIAAYEVQEGVAARATDKYREWQLELENAKTKLIELQAAGNATAQEINLGIRDAFSELFTSIANADLDSLLENFWRTASAKITEKASDGLADTIVGLLGTGGDGGIGGFFAGLFTPEGSGQLGSTAMNPLYVRMVDGMPDLPDGGTEDWSLPDGIFGPEPEKGAGGEAAEGMFDGWFGEGGTVMQGLGSLGTGIANVASAVSGGFGGLTGFLFSMLPQILTAIFSAQTSSAVSGAGGAALGAAHSGGMAGMTGMRRTGLTHNGDFSNWIRYHTGGVAGLKPNEVPTVLEKGEEVLTADDPRHRDNIGSGGGGEGAQQPVNEFIVQPVMSDSVVLQALQGSAGQKTLLVHITNNPQKFRTALGLNN